MIKANRCKHFNGTINDACDAGVNYKQLAGEPEYGYATRLPCFTDNPFGKGAVKAACDKFCLPSAEEIRERENEIKKTLEQQAKVAPLIIALKKEYKGRSAQVIRECPVCGGKLHMSISSYNGHVHGKCETANCLYWME